ncbi:putative DNA-binding pseudobarrel domain superfamily [Helianthus annuus]|nr:putative DNA-binding pseudobarrel domain superfamily [Helianthus annuus]
MKSISKVEHQLCIWRDGPTEVFFTDGWSKLVEDLLLETWSNLVFTMIGHKTFKLSVFHHETDNEIYFRKVEVVLWMILFMVMKDLIYRLLRITRRS